MSRVIVSLITAAVLTLGLLRIQGMERADGGSAAAQEAAGNEGPQSSRQHSRRAKSDATNTPVTVDLSATNLSNAGVTFRLSKDPDEQRQDDEKYRLVLTPRCREHAEKREIKRIIPARFPLPGYRQADAPLESVWLKDGTAEFDLSAPSGQYLLAIHVGQFDEGESKFSLTLGETTTAEHLSEPADTFHAPMPKPDEVGQPFGIYRLVTMDKSLRVRLVKQRHGAQQRSEGMAVIGVHLLPIDEARTLARQWLAAAERIYRDPFCYQPVELPAGRMYQVIDLAERCRIVLDGDTRLTAERLGFQARYWLVLETRHGNPADQELLRAASEVAKAQGDHADVKLYLSSWALGYPNQSGEMPALLLALSLRYRFASERWDSPWKRDRRTPGWARQLLDVRGKLDELVDYWVNQRQRQNGDLGGRLDDDVEVMRNLRLPMMFGRKDAARGFTRIADAMWASGQIREGYLSSYRDVEHSSEYVTDALGPTILPRYPDEALVARLEESAHCVPRWITRNPHGRYFFKSVYFNAHGFATDPANTNDVPRGREDMVTDGFDCAYNIQALGPAVWWLWHTRDAAVAEALGRWLKSWHTVAQRPWNNRPSGVYPVIVRFRDEAEAYGDSKDFRTPNAGFSYYNAWRGSLPWMTLALSLYYVTGEPEYLDLIEDSLRFIDRRAKDASELGEIYSQTKEQCEAIFPYWRAETGRNTYDELFEDSLSIVLVEDRSQWKQVIQDHADFLEYVAAAVADKMAANKRMFTSEVVYTDRVYVRGLPYLEPLVYGLPCDRGFSMPLFRAALEAPSEVVGTFLVTPKNRLALLAYNADEHAVKVIIRPLHLPAGEYRLEIFRRANLTNALVERDLTIRQRLDRIEVELPGREETVVVVEPLR